MGLCQVPVRSPTADGGRVRGERTAAVSGASGRRPCPGRAASGRVRGERPAAVSGASGQPRAATRTRPARATWTRPARATWTDSQPQTDRHVATASRPRRGCVPATRGACGGIGPARPSPGRMPSVRSGPVRSGPPAGAPLPAISPPSRVCPGCGGAATRPGRRGTTGFATRPGRRGTTGFATRPGRRGTNRVRRAPGPAMSR